jgi:hypothetical protein
LYPYYLYLHHSLIHPTNEHRKIPSLLSSVIYLQPISSPKTTEEPSEVCVLNHVDYW